MASGDRKSDRHGDFNNYFGSHWNISWIIAWELNWKKVWLQENVDRFQFYMHDYCGAKAHFDLTHNPLWKVCFRSMLWIAKHLFC